MVNVQELYNNLLEAAKNGNLGQVEALLQNKELSEEMITAEENKVLKTAVLNCPLPSVARFQKTNHLEIIDRLLKVDAIQRGLRLSHSHSPEFIQALDANDPKVIIQIFKEEALIEAVQAGNQAEVNKWLREITLRKVIAANAANLAICGGHLEILQSIKRELDENSLHAILNDYDYLYLAITNGHLNMVEYLLTYDIILKSLDFKHFRQACSLNHLPIVNRLLKEKSIRDIVTEEDNWACRYAASKSHFFLLDRLLQESNAIIEIGAKEGEAFEKALENRDLVMIYRIALEYHTSNGYKFKDINDLEDLQTFLQTEGYQDLETFMREYLPRLKEAFEKLDKEEKDISPIATAYRNLKPYYLLWAAEYGQLAQLEEYLHEDMGDRYLDLYYYRYNMFKLATQNGHVEVINRLLQLEDFKRCLAAYHAIILNTAITHKHLPVVNRLLQEEVVSKSLNPMCLIHAVQTGILAIVERVLQEKNDCKTFINNMALETASRRGHINIMRRLLVEPEIRNFPIFNYAFASLKEVAERGDLETLELLLQLEPIQSVFTTEKRDDILCSVVAGNHLDVAYRMVIEYQRQGIRVPVELLSQEKFKSILLENGYANFDTFIKEYPAKVKLVHDTSLAMRGSIEDLLPRVLADIVLGYSEAPEVNIYRILSPYFQMQMQVQESRDRHLQQIREGHSLKRKGAKGQSGGAAAAAD